MPPLIFSEISALQLSTMEKMAIMLSRGYIFKLFRQGQKHRSRPAQNSTGFYRQLLYAVRRILVEHYAPDIEQRRIHARINSD